MSISGAFFWIDLGAERPQLYIELAITRNIIET
jgi:hypothetical protein